MSLAFQKLPTVAFRDPRIDFNRPVAMAVKTGGAHISWQPSISTSYSSSSIQFSSPPPNSKVAIDRKIFLEVPMRLTFAGAGPALGTLLNIGTTDSLRSLPLQNGIIDNMALKLNNTSVSMNIRDFSDALMRFTPENSKRWLMSGSPMFADNYQSYDDGVAANNNPMGNYGDNTWIPGRAAFKYDIIANNQNDAIVDVSIREPLLISPCDFGESDLKALINIQTFDLQLNLSNLYRVWSHSDIAGSVINTIDVNIGGAAGLGAPKLLFNYISPPITSTIPKSVTYSYFDIDRFQTQQGGALAPGASGSFVTNNIQLGSIPSRAIIYLKRQDSDFLWTSTDTYARLDSMDIIFNNVSGILSSTTPWDLYNMSRKNGLKMSFYEWQNTVGSIVVIDFAEDVTLGSADLAPGISGNYQLTVRGVYTNIHPTEAITFQSNVVAVSEGLLDVNNRQAIPQVGVVSRSDVLTSRENPSTVDIDDLVDPYGGSFKSKLRSVERALKSDTAKRVGRTALEVGKQLSPLILSLLAAGYTESEAQELMRTSGSGVIGGRQMANTKRAKQVLIKRERERL